MVISSRTSFPKNNLRIDNDTTEVDEDTLGNYAQSRLDDQNDENTPSMLIFPKELILQKIVISCVGLNLASRESMVLNHFLTKGLS